MNLEEKAFKAKSKWHKQRSRFFVDLFSVDIRDKVNRLSEIVTISKTCKKSTSLIGYTKKKRQKYHLAYQKDKVLYRENCSKDMTRIHRRDFLNCRQVYGEICTLE